MNLTRLCAILCFCIVPLSTDAQNTVLHWYSLKSIVNLNAARGKEALAIIRSATNDSISSFTDKSNMFKLATTTPVDLNALVNLLNEEGFYIADITHNNDPPYAYHRSTLAFQHALLFCKDYTAFSELNVGSMPLKNVELNLLNIEERQLILNSSIFVIKQ